MISTNLFSQNTSFLNKYWKNKKSKIKSIISAESSAVFPSLSSAYRTLKLFEQRTHKCWISYPLYRLLAGNLNHHRLTFISIGKSRLVDKFDFLIDYGLFFSLLSLTLLLLFQLFLSALGLTHFFDFFKVVLLERLLFLTYFFWH